MDSLHAAQVARVPVGVGHLQPYAALLPRLQYDPPHDSLLPVDPQFVVREPVAPMVFELVALELTVVHVGIAIAVHIKDEFLETRAEDGHAVHE